jgi:hypothetical protein
MTKFTKVYIGFVGVAVLCLLYNVYAAQMKDSANKDNEKVISSETSSPEISKLGAKDIVEEHIAYLNKSCPLNVNNGSAKITNVYLDGNNVIYKTKLLKDIDPDIFKQQLQMAERSIMLYQYVIFNGERDEYTKASIERGLNAIFKLEFLNGERSDFTIHADEFKAVRDYVRGHRKEALQEYVNNQISYYNSFCPQEIAEGVEFKSIYRDKDFIVYEIEVDNDTFIYCKANYDQKKVEFYADIKETGWAILETCKAAKLGVTYKLVTSSGAKNIKFEYPYDTLIKDPFIQKLDMSEIKTL